MTIKDLHVKLQEIGVTEKRYYLHGLYGSTDDNDKLGMLIKKGRYNLEYEVYYRERGDKHSSRIFIIEEDACRYFLHQMINDHS